MLRGAASVGGEEGWEAAAFESGESGEAEPVLGVVHDALALQVQQEFFRREVSFARIAVGAGGD